MQKTILYALGAVLVLVGLWGFFNDPVLGIFEVNALHNVIHIATGVFLIVAAVVGGSVGALLVKIFAVVYALVAVLGLVLPGDMLLGLIEVNFADDILHLALAAILIWLGFFAGKDEGTPQPQAVSQTPDQGAGGETPSA